MPGRRIANEAAWRDWPDDSIYVAIKRVKNDFFSGMVPKNETILNGLVPCRSADSGVA
jgi:hypothetical protein